MKIFYIKLKDIQSLSATDLKNLQSAMGKKLVKHVAENFYNEKFLNIIIENKKPKFENSSLHFNVSHSRKIVAVAFDSEPVGLDVEYMSERDFPKFAKRYNLTDNSKETFYKFWTQYEAKIKIQAPIKQIFTTIIENNYMLTILSSSDNKEIEIKELNFFN